jgi:ABC-type multidrug transport system permease subunit
MSPLMQLTGARLREFFREPGTLFWVFGFPILLALALGLAFRSGTVPAVPIVVTAGPRQAERVALLSREKTFIVHAGSKAEALERLRNGKAFLSVSGTDPVVYLFDPTRPDAANLRLRINEAIQSAAGRRDPLPNEDEKVLVHGARYIDFLIPGLLGMNIMGSSMWGIGWVIVQTRTRKLLKRLMATPMRKRDYLFSHILSRLIFLVFEVGIVLLFAKIVFDVQVAGSWFALSLLCLAGAMSFAGTGLLVSSRAATSETVSGLMNAFMLPMWILSGVFFSSENFPGWMQPVIRALPLTALNEGLRAVMNEGAGLLQTGGQLAILLVWGIASFGIALKIFRWQ